MRVRAVLGPIAPEDLGITLGHEHLLRNIVPRLRHAGVSQEELDTIFIETPKRLLTLQGD